MKRILSISVACLVAISLMWLTGCTKDVEADFECPKSAYVGELVSLTNLSMNAYSYYWIIEGQSGFIHPSYGYFYSTDLYSSDYEPEKFAFDYAGEKKITLRAISKNGKKSDEKVKYITVLENPSGDSGSR